MNTRIGRFTLLALMGGLAACGSVPSARESGEPLAHFNPASDPYWQDPHWDKALLDAVQAAAHDPVDPADTSSPGLHATVKFTYLAGTIEYPAIVQSTGDAGKDELLLHQLASAQLPQATGVDADQPHEFILDVDMPTPFESFQSSIYAALDYQKVYPKDAIISGAAANTVVIFDYTDGKAHDITMSSSSDNKYLDKASLSTTTRAIMPAAPASYAGKTFHMQAVFCYTLASAINGPPVTIKNPCPVGRNVIVIQGTRIKMTTTQVMRGSRGG